MSRPLPPMRGGKALKLASLVLAGGLLAGCTATVGGDTALGQGALPGITGVAALPPPLPSPADQSGQAIPQASASVVATAMPDPSTAAFVPGTVVPSPDGTVAMAAGAAPLTVAEVRSGTAPAGIIPAALPDGTMMPVLPSDAIAVPGSPGFSAQGVQTAALAAPALPAASAFPAAPVVSAEPSTAPAAALTPAPTAPADAVAAGAPAGAPAAVSATDAAPASIPAAAAITEPAPVPSGKTSRPARKSLFENLFGSRAEPAEPVRLASAAPVGEATQKPLQELTNVSPSATSLTSLPGVETKNLFGITQGTADEELYDDHPEEPVQLASATAAGLARLAPNGILKQRDNVEVNCFKPELVRVLKSIERHYGKKLIVTSGYRSPKNNRRAGGSSRSMHMYCAAADIQIPGVGKWQLAKFLRSMPGRGGVGTYCHTDSVHIDIGSKRDWNWRCRRR